MLTMQQTEWKGKKEAKKKNGKNKMVEVALNISVIMINISGINSLMKR